MKLANIFLTILLVVLAVVVVLILMDIQGFIEIRPFRSRFLHIPRTDWGCRCYRQSNGGNRGFCGQCVNGTLFGCPGGCGGRCKFYRYSVNALPECR